MDILIFTQLYYLINYFMRQDHCLMEFFFQSYLTFICNKRLIQPYIITAVTMKKQQQSTVLIDLLTHLHKIDKQFDNEQKIEKGLLLMGETKVGKTSLLYHLMGERLLHRKNQLGVVVLYPEKVKGDIKIGEDFNSTTIFPNFIRNIDQQTISLIDMPGFSDIRPEYRLLKIYIFQRVIQLLQNVHICFILSEEMLEPNQLMKECQKLCGIVKREVVMGQGYLGFILTKAEDENVRQQFLDGIGEVAQEMKQSKDIGVIEELPNKEIHVFLNTEPDPIQGLTLRKQLINSSKFLSINANIDNILNPLFLRHLIGDTNQQEFILFLDQLVASLIDELSIVVSLGIYMVKYQFLEIMAFLMDVDVEEYGRQVVEDLENERRKSGVRELFEGQWQNRDGVKRNVIKQEFTLIYKCKETNNSNTLLWWLQRTKLIFSQRSKSQNWLKINENFIFALQETMKHSQSILLILDGLNEPYIKDKIVKISQNQRINEQINDFMKIWFNKKDKLKNFPGFNHKEGEKENRYNIIKKKRYGQINMMKEVQKELQVLKNRILKDEIQSQTFQDVIIDEQSVPVLDNNYQTLRVLLKQLQLSDRKVIHLNETILNKIIDIFSRYSLFQQAILFSMAIGDQSRIQELLTEGLIYGQLSKYFITEIMLNYLKNVSTSKRRTCLMGACVDNLLTSQTSLQKMLCVECENLRQVYDLKDNIKIQRTQQENNTINLQFIHPILENSHFYVELIKDRQQKYQKSTCRLLRSSKIFRDAME